MSDARVGPVQVVGGETAAEEQMQAAGAAKAWCDGMEGMKYREGM